MGYARKDVEIWKPSRVNFSGSSQREKKKLNRNCADRLHDLTDCIH